MPYLELCLADLRRTPEISSPQALLEKTVQYDK
jgi:hypothetical protein